MIPSDLICTEMQLTEHDETVGIYPALRYPRATVQAAWAHELGVRFEEIRVLKRYVRIFTRQEVWDNEGRERLKRPVRVPDYYAPSHCGAAWEYVPKQHPVAIPIWRAEMW